MATEAGHANPPGHANPSGHGNPLGHANPNDEKHIGWLVTDVARMMRTVFDRRARALGDRKAHV